MIDELVYQEYADWINKYEPLMKKLTDSSSPFSISFKHVYDVCEHFYNELIDNKDYEEYKDGIFKAASQYLGGIVGLADDVLVGIYKNNYEEFEKNSKTILYYLNISDFLFEVLPLIKDKNFSLNEYYDYLDTLYDDFVSSQLEVPQEFVEKFENMLDKVLLVIDPSFKTVSDIILEVAEDLGLV